MNIRPQFAEFTQGSHYFLLGMKVLETGRIGYICSCKCLPAPGFGAQWQQQRIDTVQWNSQLQSQAPFQHGGVVAGQVSRAVFIDPATQALNHPRSLQYLFCQGARTCI